MNTEKILIISDTHGFASRLKEVMEKEGSVDMVVHMGDVQGEESTIENITKAPLWIVKGNCDFRTTSPEETVMRIGKHNIFITHGHNYYVGYTHDDLEQAARDFGADMAFYGHTHVPFYEVKEDGFVILNPGSLGRPRQSPCIPSYAIANVDKDGEIEIIQKYLY